MGFRGKYVSIYVVSAEVAGLGTTHDVTSKYDCTLK